MNKLSESIKEKLHKAQLSAEARGHVFKKGIARMRDGSIFQKCINCPRGLIQVTHEGQPAIVGSATYSNCD